MFKFAAILTFLALFSFNSLAQDDNKNLEETLQYLSLDAATKYVNPIVSAFGSNLNSGWLTSVPKSVLLGLNFELKFVVQGSLFSEDAKTFNTTGKFKLTDAQADQLLNNSGYYNSPAKAALKDLLLRDEFTLNISGPTIVGNKDKPVELSFPSKQYSYNGQNYTINAMSVQTETKGYFGEIPALPNAGLQLTVGTVYGTQLALRYLPSVHIPDIGKFTFYGFGVIHNPAVYLPIELPLEVGVGFFYQGLKAGDIFKSSATQFGLYASKQFGPGVLSVTPYAGITFESSSTTVTYDYTYSISTNSGVQTVSVPINVDLDAQNSAAFTLGGKFTAGLFSFSADYKLANTSTANIGFAFVF